MTKVRYIYHSGFAVEEENRVFIFDYYDPENKFDLTNFCEGRNVYVFVSHAHGDHYDEKIFSLRGECNVKYILSDDVKVGTGEDIMFVKEGMRYIADDLKITTLKSTDEGVAFLVDTGKITIYHAGDLNWWHWNGEEESWNTGVAADYKAQIDKLTGKSIDVAFIPLDGRLEDKYLWGMDYAMKTLDIKKAFPMHFWGEFGLSRKLKEDDSSKDYREKIIDISKENEIFIL